MSKENGSTRSIVWIVFPFLSYFACACLLTFPLVLHFKDYMMCPPGQGFTYPWNIWFFTHSLEQHLNPFWNHLQYWPMGTNLLTHTYTLGHDFVGYALRNWVGPVGSFNISFLLCLALNALSGYVFVRSYGCPRSVSWVLGYALAFNPFAFEQFWLGTYEYCGYWPMTFFIYFFLKTLKEPSFRNNFISGLFLSMTFLYAQYYVTFSLIFAVFFTGLPFVKVGVRNWNPEGRLVRIGKWIFLGILLTASFWLFQRLTHQGQIIWAGRGSFAEILNYVMPYWIVFATSMICLSLWMGKYLVIEFLWEKETFFKHALAFSGTLFFYVLLNAPMIWSVLSLSKQGMSIEPPSRWRGGGSPIDIIRYIIPNAYHPLLRPLLDKLNYEPFEMDGSLGWALPAFLFFYFRKHQVDRAKPLLLAGLLSWVMSLGPYLEVFQFHTYIPLPFWLVRQVPFLGSNIQAVTFFSFTTWFFLLAAAGIGLTEILSRKQGTEKTKTWAIILAVIAFEFVLIRPWPLTYVGMSPAIKKLHDAPDGAVLVLPFGVHLRYAGTPYDDFRRTRLIDQMYHQKPVIGGVSTRVPYKIYSLFVNDPFLRELNDAQKPGAPMNKHLIEPERIKQFVKRWDARYLLLEQKNMSADLVEAIEKSWPLHVMYLSEDAALFEFVPGK